MNTQSKASTKYNKKNTRTYCLRLNEKTDHDLIHWLDGIRESKNGYIKRLIRLDLKNFSKRG